MRNARTRGKFSFLPPPLTIDIENAKIEERKVLEIDPNKIKPGEMKIIKVRKWLGLKNEYFAVQNVEGKYIHIQQLTGKYRTQVEFELHKQTLKGGMPRTRKRNKKIWSQRTLLDFASLVRLVHRQVHFLSCLAMVF